MATGEIAMHTSCVITFTCNYGSKLLHRCILLKGEKGNGHGKTYNIIHGHTVPAVVSQLETPYTTLIIAHLRTQIAHFSRIPKLHSLSRRCTVS